MSLHHLGQKQPLFPYLNRERILPILVTYRPIALTSCVCKTLERIINERLVWFLEKKKLLTEFQSGFRKQRSTTDQLVRFETFIREGFVRREHVVSVFFDLEKAYDTTWKHGILQDLHNYGLRGRLPEFISNFLASRHFRVRIGSCLSELHDQEAGVPQGSILSVTLFLTKINSIVECLPPSIKCSLYVDDFLICYRSKNMNSIERLLQLCLNNIQNWADENGFQFSKTKTVCIHFCQQHILHNDPELKLDGVPIPVVAEYKFLGLIFDRKLNFIPHIKYVKDRCYESYEFVEGCRSHGLGCGCCNAPKVVSFARQIETRLRMHCVRVSKRVIPATSGPRAERCPTHLPRCLQDVPHSQFTRGGKRATSEPCEGRNSHCNTSQNLGRTRKIQLTNVCLSPASHFCSRPGLLSYQLLDSEWNNICQIPA